MTQNYNAKGNTKSNWCTAYFHCGPCSNLHNTCITPVLCTYTDLNCWFRTPIFNKLSVYKLPLLLRADKPKDFYFLRPNILPEGPGVTGL